MNNKRYLKKIVSEEASKIKQNRYIKKLISEEYSKLLESGASDIRSTLDKLHYVEREHELDSGGSIPNYASVLFKKFFEFVADEHPDVRIEVTGGHDEFHKKYKSRHNFGEAIDFIVTAGKVSDVRSALKSFKSKHGSDFKWIDEYKKQTDHATGAHFHMAYIGSQSSFAKDKASGGKGGVTTQAAKESAMNQWTGEASDGTDLAKLDSILAEFASKSKSGQATMVKFQREKIMSHKWVLRIPVRAAEMEEHDPEQKPNEDGIIPGKGEKIDFYPNGTVNLFNHGGTNDDVEIEPAKQWWKRMQNITKIAAAGSFPTMYMKALSKASNMVGYDNQITKAMNSDNWIDKLHSMTNPEVLTIYNKTGDIMGSVMTDPKYGLVFDIGNSPMFAVDEDGDATWGHGKGMDIFQTILDVVGFIPFWGDIVDIINAVIYYIRGRNLEAAFSIIAVIPVIGSVIKWGAKGSLKVGKMSAKLFFKKITFGALFKSTSKASIKEAEELIKGLQKMNVVDASDLAWLGRSGVIKGIFKLIVKTEKAMKGYLPKSVYSKVDDGIVAMKNFVDSFDGALKVLNKGSKSKTISKLAPDAQKTFRQTKMGKWSKGIKNQKGFLRKIAQMSKLKLLPVAIGRVVNKLRNVFLRMPPAKLKLISKYIDQTTVKLFQNNPQKFKYLLTTMDPALVYRTFDPTYTAKQVISKGGEKLKLSLKDIDELIKQYGSDAATAKLVLAAKNQGNYFLRTIMESPSMFVLAQTQSLKKQNFAKMFKTSMGTKNWDIYYNELSELVEKEFGFDVGNYGGENQSIVYYLFYKSAYVIGQGENMEKSRDDRRSEIQYGDSMLATSIRSIANDLGEKLGFEDYLKTHDQIWAPLWNEVPGETDKEKLLWVSKNTNDPKDLKNIQKILDGEVSNKAIDKGKGSD